jgi:hypothetical protein
MLPFSPPWDEWQSGHAARRAADRSCRVSLELNMSDHQVQQSAAAGTIGYDLCMILARRIACLKRTTFEEKMHPDTMAAVTVHFDHWHPYRGYFRRNAEESARSSLSDCVDHLERSLSGSLSTHLSPYSTFCSLGTCSSVPFASCFLSAALSETAAAPERAPVLQLDQGGYC